MAGAAMNKVLRPRELREQLSAEQRERTRLAIAAADKREEAVAAGAPPPVNNSLSSFAGKCPVCGARASGQRWETAEGKLHCTACTDEKRIAICLYSVRAADAQLYFNGWDRNGAARFSKKLYAKRCYTSERALALKVEIKERGYIHGASSDWRIILRDWNDAREMYERESGARRLDDNRRVAEREARRRRVRLALADGAVIADGVNIGTHRKGKLSDGREVWCAYIRLAGALGEGERVQATSYSRLQLAIADKLPSEGLSQ